MRKNTKRTDVRKAQSAIEYLVTYGWVFLILALILVVLFQLGVFNSNTFSVRAQPGVCHVSRPNGPYTYTLMSLAGVCQNTPPEYVASFSGSGSVIVGPRINTFITNSITITAWFKSTTTSASNLQVAGNNVIELRFVSTTGTVKTFVSTGAANSGVTSYATSLPLNTWIFAAATYNGNVLSIYVNGTLQGTKAVNEPLYIASGALSNVTVGAMRDSSGNVLFPFVGSVSNVQIYNSSLSASEIEALYVDGIGGAPVVSPNLLGWWPLNNNANDYSGNNNNAYNSVSITYSSQWTSGYVVP